MSWLSPLRCLARAFSGRSLGACGALIGFGYGLSFDKPMSYVPYGVCRSYEGLSEVLPRLRNRRLGVYDRASRFAERWRMESPFLNAYLLDRLCRESVARRRKLQHVPIGMTPSTMTLPPPVPERKVEQPPTQQPTSEPKVADNISAMNQSTESSGVSSDVPALVDSTGDIGPVVSPSVDLTKPSITDTWTRPISDLCHRSRQRLTEAFSPSFLIAKTHDILFPGAAKEPCFLSVLDRIHHLVTSLDPYCTDVERLRSVYLTVSNFLDFSVKQKAFHDQLFHESSLEHDKLILQFFHISLLATHRMEYLNEYERLAVTPAPPQPLPTGEVLQPPTPTLWSKTTTRTTSVMKGIVSNFNPSTDQKAPKGSTLTPSPSEKISPSPAPFLQRRRPIWTGHDVALDCRQKMRNVWKAVNSSTSLTKAASRIIWNDEFNSSHLERDNRLRLVSDNKEKLMLESKIAKETEILIELTGAIKELVKKFNRTPMTANDSEICFEMNKGIQTPFVLNPFGDQYSPHRFSQFVQRWILYGPVIPFVLGAVATTIWMIYPSNAKEPFFSRLWLSIMSLFDYTQNSLPQRHLSESVNPKFDPYPQQFTGDSSAGLNDFHSIVPEINSQSSIGFIPSSNRPIDTFPGFDYLPDVHSCQFVSYTRPDTDINMGNGFPIYMGHGR